MTIKLYSPKWWKEGCETISKDDPIMEALIKKYKNNKLTTIKNPFFSLSKSIVGQQISVAAASAIWKRLEENFSVIEGCCFKNTDFNKLKLIGLSERKALYLINLSEKLKYKSKFSYWNKLSDDKIYSILIDLNGVGPWTIKMFLIFCLNRPDIFSSDDIGLLKGLEQNYFNKNRPNKEQAEIFSHKWKPWRTVACWYLWRSIDPEIVLY